MGRFYFNGGNCIRLQSFRVKTLGIFQLRERLFEETLHVAYIVILAQKSKQSK